MTAGGLQASLGTVRGIGPVRLRALEAAGFFTIEDLLRHLPARYEDRRTILQVSEVRTPGVVTVVARIENAPAGALQTRIDADDAHALPVPSAPGV